jgi:hypothetical protein
MQEQEQVCRSSLLLQLAPAPLHCGVAQAGKSVRLINERLRVQIPPPQPTLFAKRYIDERR